jgi:hypothetical protein
MTYVMTDEHKRSGRQPEEGYIERIKQAYKDLGFADDEFNPQ